jgi:hypothetical protein
MRRKETGKVRGSAADAFPRPGWRRRLGPPTTMSQTASGKRGHATYSPKGPGPTERMQRVADRGRTDVNRRGEEAGSIKGGLKVDPGQQRL